MRKRERKPVSIVMKLVMKSCFWEFFWKFFISILMRVSLLIIPILYSDAIDYASKSNFEKAYYLVLISVVVTVFYYIIEMINQKLFYNLYRKFYQRYTEIASSCTFRNSVYSLSRFSLGEYTNIMNNDIDIITSYFSNGVMRLVQVGEFIFIYGYFLSLDIYIFLITVMISAIMLMILLHFGKRTQELNVYRKASLDKKTAIVHETFNGMKEIKGFHFFHKIDERVQDSSRGYLKDHAKYNIQYQIARFFILCVIAVSRLCLIFYGIYLVSKGQMEIGMVLIIYSYYQKIIDNFDVISTISVETRNLKVSLNRFNKLLEYAHPDEDRTYVPEREYQGKIRFENVIYGNKSDPILNDVSFEVKEHAITVITGKVGSGKTGVFDLLVRLNDKHSGEIYIDEDRIEDIHPEYYYNLISVVRKNPMFFHTSIKENLMLVDDDFEKIVEICKLLQIDDDILRLSSGYDTNIYSEIDNISNELKYMLAIARVLIRNPKIMLFDQCVGVLDNEHQQVVLRLLSKLKEDHTIILISREQSIIKYADEIIVIDGNMVVEQGRQKELMRKKGYYYRLFELS